MDLKKENNILSNVRTKETYRSKILSQSRGSQSGVFLSVGNFENYCMQQYGKPNIIPDMLESTEIERIDTLQLWISYMNNPFIAEVITAKGNDESKEFLTSLLNDLTTTI